MVMYAIWSWVPVIQSTDLHLHTEQNVCKLGKVIKGNIVNNRNSELLSVDFLGPLSWDFRRLRRLIVYKDVFINTVRLQPVTCPNTKTLLNSIIYKYILKNGAVGKIISGQRRQFQNALWSPPLISTVSNQSWRWFKGLKLFEAWGLTRDCKIV